MFHGMCNVFFSRFLCLFFKERICLSLCRRRTSWSLTNNEAIRFLQPERDPLSFSFYLFLAVFIGRRRRLEVAGIGPVRIHSFRPRSWARRSTPTSTAASLRLLLLGRMPKRFDSSTANFGRGRDCAVPVVGSRRPLIERAAREPLSYTKQNKRNDTIRFPFSFRCTHTHAHTHTHTKNVSDPERPRLRCRRCSQLAASAEMLGKVAMKYRRTTQWDQTLTKP